MSEESLLPCPFCGEIDALELAKAGKMHTVRCLVCGACGPAQYNDGRHDGITDMAQRSWNEAQRPKQMSSDTVNHPAHYQHASGVECITIAEHETFCIGNALKYIWRRGKKGDEILDLRKAIWYIEREIARLEDK